jgi:hypothetical protein
MGERTSHSYAVTLAAAGVFLLAAGNFLEFGLALARFQQIQSLPLTVPAWYFLAGGAVWGMMYLISAVGIARHRLWGYWTAMLTLLLQFAAWAVDMAFYRHPAIVTQSIIFDAAIRCVLVALGVVILVRLGRPPYKPQTG